MRALSQARCLACGGTLLAGIVAAPAADGQLEVVITVGHVGSMDAACRWSAELYGDRVSERWSRRALPG